MELLPFKSITVNTPTGAVAEGKDTAVEDPEKQICSVTYVSFELRIGGMNSIRSCVVLFVQVEC